jgi:hypothetical protein
MSCSPDYQHVVVAIVLPRTQFYPIRRMEMSRRWSLESIVPCKSGEESTHAHEMGHILVLIV